VSPDLATFWSSPDHTLRGLGELLSFDPGTGADRYTKTGDWLASVDRAVGFASFTFDADQRGSVVLAPEEVTEGRVDWSSGDDGRLLARLVADGRAEWENGFSIAMSSISAGELEKVVLARQVEVELSEPFDPHLILERLVWANPSTYVFLNHGLVGASPELLVSLEGDRVRSMVLAGTATKADQLADARIEMEHDLAARSVAAGLRVHSIDLIGERSVIQVGVILHVATDFTAKALPGTKVLDLLSSIHPTAAVAGTPTPAALALIRAMEPRGRGRYAGPVGWFDTKGDGEFAIALRCGEFDQNRGTIYAGGGLVPGSDRQSEWAETDLKLGPMLRALGVEAGHG
jgi:menaquinone-specific isochorismate synthase